MIIYSELHTRDFNQTDVPTVTFVSVAAVWTWGHFPLLSAVTFPLYYYTLIQPLLLELDIYQEHLKATCLKPLEVHTYFPTRVLQPLFHIITI